MIARHRKYKMRKTITHIVKKMYEEANNNKNRNPISKRDLANFINFATDDFVLNKIKELHDENPKYHITMIVHSFTRTQIRDEFNIMFDIGE